MEKIGLSTIGICCLVMQVLVQSVNGTNYNAAFPATGGDLLKQGCVRINIRQPKSIYKVNSRNIREFLILEAND